MLADSAFSGKTRSTVVHGDRTSHAHPCQSVVNLESRFRDFDPLAPSDGDRSMLRRRVISTALSALLFLLLKVAAQAQFCNPQGTGFIYHQTTCATAGNFTYNNTTQQVSLTQNLANTALALYRYSD